MALYYYAVGVTGYQMYSFLFSLSLVTSSVFLLLAFFTFFFLHFHLFIQSMEVKLPILLGNYDRQTDRRSDRVKGKFHFHQHHKKSPYV